MGVSVSKTPRTGAQRGVLQGATRNEVKGRNKKEENVSKATIDDGQREDKTLSQETNESKKDAEQYLGSDEACDSTSQSADQIYDTVIDQKRLFECNILPVSSDLLWVYKCTKCEKDVDCSHSLLSFNGSCIIFTKTKCVHRELACDTIELENNVRFHSKTRVIIKPMTNSVFCISSGEIYSVYLCSVQRCLINKKELTCNMLFSTSDICTCMTGFNHGFALLIKALGHSVALFQIQYVDALGNVKRFVYKKPNGDDLLKNPTSLESNYAENILYVIDGNTILVLDTAGVLLKCIEFETTPTCVTADNENNMYVACDKDLIQLNDQFERRVLMKGDTKSAKIEAITWVNSARGLVVIRGIWINLYKLLP